MITPLHILFLAPQAPAGLLEAVIDSFMRAGYAPVVRRITSAAEMAAAMGERPWDAVLMHPEPAGMEEADVKAWLERCRESAPIVVLAAGETDRDHLLRVGIAEVLTPEEHPRVALAIARARRAAGGVEHATFRTFAGRAPVPLFRVGVDGHVLYANRAMVHLLGEESASELLGRHLGHDLGFPFDEFVARIDEQGEISGDLLSWRLADGSTALLRQTGWAVRAGDDRPAYYEGMLEAVELATDSPHPNGDGDGQAAELDEPSWAHHPAIEPPPFEALATASGEPSRIEDEEIAPAETARPADPPSDDLLEIARGVGAEVIHGDGSPLPTPAYDAPDDGAHQTDLEQPENRVRVLVLEDNQETKHLLERVLKPRYEVEAVSDARSALDVMSRHHFDLLLVDIHLGGKETGSDVLRIARTLPGYDRVPAIAVTAYALPGDRKAMLEAGFDDYVAKPFTVRGLLDTIEAHVNRLSGV